MRISDWSSDVCSSDLDARIRCEQGFASHSCIGRGQSADDLCRQRQIFERGLVRKQIERLENHANARAQPVEIGFCAVNPLPEHFYLASPARLNSLSVPQTR